MKLNIEPYRGALPLAFGMARRDVHLLLGIPDSSHRIWDNSGFSDNYDSAQLCVGYDGDDLINHVGVSPGGCDLCILERAIWTKETQPDPNPLLLSLDPDPVEVVGFWYYLRIGVATTGYHDDDSGQRAISVFLRDAKTELLEDSVPADTSRYRPSTTGQR